VAMIQQVDEGQHAADSGLMSEPRAKARTTGSVGLRLRLILVDILAVVMSWSVVLLIGSDPGASKASIATGTFLIAAATIAALRGQQLYRSRVAAIRSEEVARLGRVAVVSAIAAVVADQLVELALSPAQAVAGAICVFLLLVFGRGRYQMWISRKRSVGQFARPVVVVGNSDEVSSLVELFYESPELGFAPVGISGSREAHTDPNVRWLGDSGNVLSMVARSGATGVVIATGSMSSEALNRLVRELHNASIHVHLSSGLTGVNRRRLRVQPVGYEPLIYIEPAKLSKAQDAAKRTLDIVGSTVALVLFAPLIITAAIAVKWSDGGPAFFRQERTGRRGQTFTIFKLRTMCVDAEERLSEVQAQNERQGPLFKLEDDPRVTRVGRFLRTSSIDELPQLLNVLTGTMSLVGPRPALPLEVSEFDGRLVDRLQVRPGMSGLWQVEARDKASFSAYRRLDLYYVENWSLWLDLAILLKTGGVVLRKGRSAIQRRVATLPAAAPVLEPVE
jgi:exopolysaccharide biosynthesis polyprenyl glycosylphosphotransferase